MADFARALDRPHCWLNAEPRFSDPVELVQALAHAAEPIAAGCASAVQAAVRSAPDKESAPSLGVAALVRALQPPAAGLVVVDDAHHLAGELRALRALEGLIERLPSGWAILLAGRCLPEVRCAETAGRIVWDELALTAEETCSLLSAMHGGPVPWTTAQRRWRETGGWPAALVAAGVAESAQPAAVDAAASETAPSQFDGLARDLLVRLDPSERHLLKRAAVPRTLDAETYAIVTSFRPDGALPLSPDADLPIHPAGLARRHAFITREAGELGRFRMHDLFRDFLLSQACLAAPKLVSALHTRLGRRSEERAEDVDAQYHYGRAENWAAFARVAEATAELRQAQGRYRSLTEFVDQLPQAVKNQRPSIVLIQASAFASLGERDPAQEALKFVETRIRYQPDSALSCRILAVRARLLLEIDQVDAPEIAHQVQEAVLANGASDTLLAEAVEAIGVVFGNFGAYEEASLGLVRIASAARHAGLDGVSARATDLLGCVHLSGGRPAEAISHLQDAHSYWTLTNSDVRLAINLNNLGLAHLITGDIEQAETLLNNGLISAWRAQSDRATATVLVTRARMFACQNQSDAALEAALGALAVAERTSDPYVKLYSYFAVAEGELLSGHIATAERLALQGNSIALARPGTHDQAIAAYFLGRVLLAKGETGQAIAQLERSTQMLQGCGALTELVEAQAVLAVTLHVAGQLERAVALLATAATAAARCQIGLLVARHAQLAPKLFEATAALHPEIKVLREFHRREEPVAVRESSAAVAEMLQVSAEESSAEEASPLVEVFALGGLQLRVDGRELRLARRGDRSLELLLYLLAQRAPAPRGQICAALWPERDSQAALASLHSTVYRLRRLLYHDCVLAGYRGYTLNPAGSFTFDVREFLALTEPEQSNGTSGRGARLAEAVALYGGAFASGSFGEWAEPLRATCEERYLASLLELAEQAQAVGDAGRAGEYAGRAWELERSFEPAARALFEAHLLGGRAEEALRLFRRYRRVTADEGLEPSTEFVAAYRCLLDGRAG